MSGTARERGAARALARGEALLEEAAERSRPATIAERLRANWRWFAQAALATAPAWWLARELFGHPRPIFAPMVALIAISTTLGQRRRYAVEMVLGVALGIAIADGLFTLIGGGTMQIAAIVVIAMVSAVIVGGSAILVSEAAISAMLVVTLQPPGSGLSGARFIDSLLGGVIGIIVTSILPANPAVAVHRAAKSLLDEIAATMDDIATALESRDADLADAAWNRAAAIETDPLEQALAAGRETLRLAPFLRGTRSRFGRHAVAAVWIDSAITTVEAMARGAVRALRQGDNVPPAVGEAIREVADAVRRLEAALADDGDPTAVREPALRAAARATLVLEQQTANLSVSAIVVQVRSAAVDMLRGSGLQRDEAERLVREAVRSLA
ncbi:MAG: hypothetical protein QOJ21_3307 [Solirubrobacteraceae bacterium]|nr:hypothetical protein [Solirubrobacteraceae bacterium]